MAPWPPVASPLNRDAAIGCVLIGFSMSEWPVTCDASEVSK